MPDTAQHLIDISGFNPVSDWRAVRADGIVGASIKISQATNYLNPLRAAQIVGARGAGVAPGGYHFGDPRFGATDQARFFVNNAKPYGLFEAGALAPMYDAENWDGNFNWAGRTQLSTHIREWVKVVSGETGARRVLVYGSQSWWAGRWLVPEDWAVDGVEILNWVAIYNGDPGNLGGWSHPLDALHQHTSGGIVPGIPDRVDKNVTLRGRTVGGLTLGSNHDDKELDMALSDDDVQRIANAVAGIMVPVGYERNEDGTPVLADLPMTEHLRGTNHGVWTQPAEVAKLVQTCHDDLVTRLDDLGERVSGIESGAPISDVQLDTALQRTGVLDDVMRYGTPIVADKATGGGAGHTS